MINTQLYELAMIREQEYMENATTRRGGYRPGRFLAQKVSRVVRRRSNKS